MARSSKQKWKSFAIISAGLCSWTRWSGRNWPLRATLRGQHRTATSIPSRSLASGARIRSDQIRSCPPGNTAKSGPFAPNRSPLGSLPLPHRLHRRVGLETRRWTNCRGLFGSETCCAVQRFPARNSEDWKWREGSLHEFRWGIALWAMFFPRYKAGSRSGLRITDARPDSPLLLPDGLRRMQWRAHDGMSGLVNSRGLGNLWGAK